MAASALISGYLALGSALANNVMTELSGNGYARQAVAVTYDPVTGTMYIGGATFGPDVTSNWTAAAYVGLYDASSAGNLTFTFPIPTTSVAVGQSYTVPASYVTLTPTNKAFFVAGGTLPAGTALGLLTDLLATGLTGATVTSGPVPLNFSALLVMSASVLIYANTYAASFAWNWANGTNQNVTLTGNITTYGAPTNGVPGTRYRVSFIQDGTGSRTLGGINAVFKHVGGAPTLSTAANAIDVIEYYYDGVTYWGETIAKAMA